MAKTSRAIPLQEVIAQPEAAEMVARRPGDAQHFAERFDPFHDPYLADPYPFFAEARAATPGFYSPDLDYWVVTRYHDIEQISRKLRPKLPESLNVAHFHAPRVPRRRSPRSRSGSSIRS